MVNIENLSTTIKDLESNILLRMTIISIYVAALLLNIIFIEYNLSSLFFLLYNTIISSTVFIILYSNRLNKKGKINWIDIEKFIDNKLMGFKNKIKSNELLSVEDLLLLSKISSKIEDYKAFLEKSFMSLNSFSEFYNNYMSNYVENNNTEKINSLSCQILSFKKIYLTDGQLNDFLTSNDFNFINIVKYNILFDEQIFDNYVYPLITKESLLLLAQSENSKKKLVKFLLKIKNKNINKDLVSILKDILGENEFIFFNNNAIVEDDTNKVVKEITPSENNDIVIMINNIKANIALLNQDDTVLFQRVIEDYKKACSLGYDKDNEIHNIFLSQLVKLNEKVKHNSVSEKDKFKRYLIKSIA